MEEAQSGDQEAQTVDADGAVQGTEPSELTAGEAEGDERHGLSRRSFIAGTGLVLSAPALVQLAGCEPTSTPASYQTTAADMMEMMRPMPHKYIDVPPTPVRPPNPNHLQVLTPHEAATVDALASRIIPGDASDPGAHEAGVLNYIDNMLAWHEGVVTPTYAMPPFAAPYTGSNPPPEMKVEGFPVTYVKKSELKRYGAQSQMSPKDVYRLGIRMLDQHAKAAFGDDFSKLNESDQDHIIGQLAEGKPGSMKDPSASDFFTRIRSDTIQGMFADPLYGGNRNMLGWKMIQYPGVHRAWTEHDIHTPGTNKRMQSLEMMMPFDPGQETGSNVLMPVSGHRKANP